MSVHLIAGRWTDIDTGEVVPVPRPETTYKDKPRHTDYELSRMKRPRSSYNRHSLEIDIIFALAVYSILVTVLLLT